MEETQLEKLSPPPDSALALRQGTAGKIRGGSGQFFCHWVGFRVFRFCSGWVSGQRNLVRVKLGSNFFSFFSQFWLYLATN